MAWVEYCPELPQNGICPVSTEWREVASTLPLTYEQFLTISPYLGAVLLTFYGFRLVLRHVNNRL